MKDVPTPKDIKQIIDMFQIEVDGITAWIPYWTNSRTHIGYSLFTKAHPRDIEKAAREFVGTKNTLGVLGHIPKNPEELRLAIFRMGMGIDCSGFVYHFLDEALKITRGTEFRVSDYLYIKLQDVKNNLENNEWWNLLPEKTLPDKESLTLTEMNDLTGVPPENQTNVTRLIESPDMTKIYNVEDIKLGDIMYFKGKHSNHIAIISGVDDKKIHLADSQFGTTGFGGIREYHIEIPRKDMSITDIHISDNLLSHGVVRFNPLYE